MSQNYKQPFHKTTDDYNKLREEYLEFGKQSLRDLDELRTMTNNNNRLAAVLMVLFSIMGLSLGWILRGLLI